MDSLFRQIGILRSQGQSTSRLTRDLSIQGSKDGQILEEGSPRRVHGLADGAGTATQLGGR